MYHFAARLGAKKRNALSEAIRTWRRAIQAASMGAQGYLSTFPLKALNEKEITQISRFAEDFLGPSKK